MKLLKMMKLSLPLHLIVALAAVVSAQTPSSSDLSTSPSPVQTSAEALIKDLETPIKCDDGTTLCVAEVMQARLTAAVAGLHSIVRIDQDRERIIAMQERALAVADKITAKYGKVDSNNQTIDANQIENARIYREQIADDKLKIGDLQHRLDSCQSNQKWIALVSGVGGGFLGYKLHGVTSNFTNPFAQFTTNAAPANYPFSFYQQTDTEKKLRAILHK